MSKNEVLFRAHDYPDIFPGNTPTKAHRPHRAPKKALRKTPPNVCPYSPSYFTCPLPDCKQKTSACTRLNPLK